MRTWSPKRLWQRRIGLYSRQRRAEHRVVAAGHGQQPHYSTRMRRMLTRLFR